MEIKKDFKNELMKRREISILVESEKTLSKGESVKIVSDNFKANSENVLVEQIKGSFGVRKFLITASIYDTKELKEEAEKRQVKAKKKEGEQEEKTEEKK